jgi:hypothetical protein
VSLYPQITQITQILCNLCNLWITDLRAEAVTVFIGIDEAEDHVPEVARVGCQGCDPVIVTNRVWISSQVAEVLHRHECADEELVRHARQLHDLAQHLRPRLLVRVQRRH